VGDIPEESPCRRVLRYRLSLPAGEEVEVLFSELGLRDFVLLAFHYSNYNWKNIRKQL
jgi:hypothetical protein